MKTTTRTLTEDTFRYLESGCIGLCANCGEERMQTEPDAEEYPCESCELRAVFGAENCAFGGCDWTDHDGKRVRTSWIWSASGAEEDARDDTLHGRTL